MEFWKLKEKWRKYLRKKENNFFASHVSSLLRRKKSGVVLKSRSRCLKNFRNRQPGKTLEEIRTLGELKIFFSASRKCHKIASDQIKVNSNNSIDEKYFQTIFKNKKFSKWYKNIRKQFKLLKNGHKASKKQPKSCAFVHVNTKFHELWKLSRRSRKWTRIIAGLKWRGSGYELIAQDQSTVATLTDAPTQLAAQHQPLDALLRHRHSESDRRVPQAGIESAVALQVRLPVGEVRKRQF